MIKSTSCSKKCLTAPPRAFGFTGREIELAHQIRAMGRLSWRVFPGIFLYDDREQVTCSEQLGHHVYMVLDDERFTLQFGGEAQVYEDWTWLPTWEEACFWLKQQGKNNAEILDRVRERVVDSGVSHREALYELIRQTIKEQITS